MVDHDSLRPAPEPVATLGEVLLALGGRLTRLQTEILAGLGQPLTIRQYRILSRVDAGNTSLTSLSKLARRNLSTMSQSVDKLVQQGLLTRKTSESSRRTMQLALTAEGAAALDAGNRALAKFTSELTTRMPQELQDQILPALQQLFTDVQGDLDDR
ncbi:MarR family winged helix-turn-helix transcriptional regulator [Streptomyces malaysiensis]|uniref:MarR family winged helix-turn-helix transcriptional regulator n=1 Tax=Streptomyces malaysiensis TaxID=92644 RepID=UPI002B2A8163|nr:MarR family transcriptional regulator [Streptomyces malaysiensis]